MQDLLQSLPIDTSNLWVVSVFFVGMATAVIAFFEKSVYQRTVAKLGQTPRIWDDALLWAMHKPLMCFIWLWGLSYAVELSPYKAQMPAVFEWMEILRGAATILLATWSVWRITRRIEHRYLGRELREDAWFDHTTAQAVGQIMRVSIFIVSTLVILKYFFHIPLTGLWALGGAGSLVIGLAAKDLLANFFGAIMIYFDRPFAVGDRIRSPDRELEGIVEYIGWRLTRVRTLEKRLLYIPNAIFASVSVENVTRMSHRRIRTTVGIRYQDSRKILDITTAIKDMLKAHTDIDSQQPIIVNLSGFGASSLEILICCYTKSIQWVAFQAIQQDVLIQVLDIIKDFDADLAYPTQTIEVKQGQLETEASLALLAKQEV